MNIKQENNHYDNSFLFKREVILQLNISRPNVVTRAMSQSLAMFTKIFVCIDVHDTQYGGFVAVLKSLVSRLRWPELPHQPR